MLLRFRFAFESPIISWAEEAAFSISTVLSRECSDVTFKVFREAFLCMKSTPRHTDWVSMVVLINSNLFMLGHVHKIPHVFNPLPLATVSCFILFFDPTAIADTWVGTDITHAAALGGECGIDTSRIGSCYCVAAENLKRFTFCTSLTFTMINIGFECSFLQR